MIYGGVVRLAVPRFTDAERRRVVRTLDDVLERLGEGQQAEVAHDGADLYAMWAEACGNASLAQLCRATTDGLAFRLRVPELAEVVPPEAVTPRVRELRDAVAANDPIAAELAMEAAHLLPTRN
ncbi:FCD domain-containing protein [Curtobacterium sp. MCJR17_043]|uniref:FCD domain-containing protein n=1 Tax=Curtobacterium sp. MCJR17_043 TaxID=2175660 RepID=UPI0032E9160D